MSATLDPAVWPRIPDLCDPASLTRIGVTAEIPAVRDRRRTQRIALDLHGQGHVGLRWWSAFWGEWHSVIAFHDQLASGVLTYGRPMPLDTSSEPVRDAALLLDIG